MGLLNAASWLKGTIDGWLETIENLDPSKNLKGIGKIGAQLNKINPLQALTKNHDGEKFQDTRPSEVFEEVHVDARFRPGAPKGTVEVELLCAGGWTSVGVGDTFSAEDCYGLVVLDGGVGITSIKDNAKVPAWSADERRAFRFRVVDPAATLYVAIFDDDPNPLQSDDPIGRCAIGLRSLAPDATYDAWFPLTYAATEGEDLATKGRALVAEEPLATAATNCNGKNTQKDSRGAVRLRVKVTWDDGGVKMAKSALKDLVFPAKPQYVTFPATKGGKALRENVRFAMYGEGACPHDAVNEPFSIGRVSDHAHELVDVLLGAVGGLKDKIVALVMYRNPVRSLLALLAWLTSVSNGARGVAWFWLLTALDLRDTLAGVKEDDRASLDDNIVPRLSKPQFPMRSWAKGALTGFGETEPTSTEEFQAAKRAARGDAEAVAIELMLEEWRASGKIEAIQEEEDEDVVDEDDYLSKKPMKTFRSFHILKPFLLPVQRLLLGLLLPLRALKGLANGRADPVATATLAAACLLIGVGTMIYAQFVHAYVMWFLGWVFTVLLYVIGVALFGPQNYFLVKAHVRKKRARQRMRALAAFDPTGKAALNIQDFYRKYTVKLKELAKAAKKRAEDEKGAAKREAAAEAKAKASQDKLDAEAKARRAAVALADRTHLQALHARQEEGGTIKAKKNSHLFSTHTVKHLKLSADNKTFIYADPPGKGGFGSHETKSVHLKNVTRVAPYDASKPQMLKFRAGHKEYEFLLEDMHERSLMAFALRAASARLANHPSMVGKGGQLRLAVPAKPLGFLNASLVEREPSVPEPFRSRILPDVAPGESLRLATNAGAPPAADASPGGCSCEVA